MVQCSNCSKYISLVPTGKPINIHIYDNGQTLVTCPSGHGLDDEDQIRIYDTTCTHPVEGTYTVDLAANPTTEFYIPYAVTVAEECTGYFISLSDEEPDDLYDNPQIKCFSYYYLPDDGGGGGSGGGITYCGCTCANCCPTGFIWFYYFIASQPFSRCVSNVRDTAVHLCLGKQEIDLLRYIRDLTPAAFDDVVCPDEVGSASVGVFEPDNDQWQALIKNYEIPENSGSISYDEEAGIIEITTAEPHFLVPGASGNLDPEDASLVEFVRIGPGIMTFSHEWIEWPGFEDKIAEITTGEHHILDPLTALFGWFTRTDDKRFESLGSIVSISGPDKIVVTTTDLACACRDEYNNPIWDPVLEKYEDCCSEGKVRYEHRVTQTDAFFVINTPTDKKFQIRESDLTPEDKEGLEEADCIIGNKINNLSSNGNNINCQHVLARYKYWYDWTKWASERWDSECLFDFVWGSLIPFGDEILDYLCCSEIERTLSLFDDGSGVDGCCLEPSADNFYNEWNEIEPGQLKPKYNGNYAWLNQSFTTVGHVVARITSNVLVSYTCSKLPKMLPSQKEFTSDYLGSPSGRIRISLPNNQLQVGEYIYVESIGFTPELSGVFQVVELDEENPNRLFIDSDNVYTPGQSGTGYGSEYVESWGGPCNVAYNAVAKNYLQFLPPRNIARIFCEIPEDRQLCGTVSVIIQTSIPHLFCEGDQVLFSHIFINETPEDLLIPINYDAECEIHVINEFKFSVDLIFEECFEVPEGNPEGELSLGNTPTVLRKYQECCTTIVVLDDKNNKTQFVNLDATYCTSCAEIKVGYWQQACCPDNVTTADCFSNSCEGIPCEGTMGTMNINGCDNEDTLDLKGFEEKHTIYYKKNYYEGDTHRGFTEFIACPTPPPAAFRSRTLSQELGILSENNGFIDFYKNEKNQIEKINISKKNYKKKQITFKVNEWNDLDKSNKTFLQIKYNKKAYRKTSCIFKILEKIQETPTHYEFKVSQIFGTIPEDDMIANVEFILPPKTTSTLSKLNKLEILKRIRKRRY